MYHGGYVTFETMKIDAGYGRLKPSVRATKVVPTRLDKTKVFYFLNNITAQSGIKSAIRARHQARNRAGSGQAGVFRIQMG